MKKTTCIELTSKELLNINGGKTIATNATYYPNKWAKSVGKWIASKIK
ncbi:MULTISPECIES: hypothetical protein [Bacillus]|uniref:Uncharacterized protein n=1 Tax=Bacillus cereus 03BB108 TaxID=451709 RepID=A0AAN0T0E5_BACCE|nr:MULTISPECIES: hypothetical protein [Bacillus]AJI13416.1 hypothetical protein AK40_3758 [Bacillus cereus 03BB108]EEM57137.1 hypothetical protein bthur0007_49520 [Bacillus thuringiensis serovar monterrey BGSC 4AJ1]MCU5380991.1 hypothetical protein [Bacillus cereus]MDA1606725.1 hypothetical protein [Bacillus cereus group sp. TH208-1LC]MDA1689829.1 hypothetical protein [Bacillus cereus group sp. TH147LC]